MAPTPEQNLEFIYLVLKHATLTPDWWAIGAEYSKVTTPTRHQKDNV